MKAIITFLFLLAFTIYAPAQRYDLTNYIGDTVVVKDIPSYMQGYSGFYTRLRPTPVTTEERQASFKINLRNDSTILHNDGYGRTPINKLSRMRFFCSKRIAHDRYTYLELVNKKYGTLYYRVSDYGDFMLNTIEAQKVLDKINSALLEKEKEHLHLREESKSLLSQLTYGTDEKYHYKKTIKIEGAQTQTLITKGKEFFKDNTQSTEGPIWKQIPGTNKVIGSISYGSNLLMDVSIQNSLGQYTYDIFSIEYKSEGSWSPAEVLLSSTNPILDEHRTSVLTGILYVSREIENRIK